MISPNSRFLNQEDVWETCGANQDIDRTPEKQHTSKFLTSICETEDCMQCGCAAFLSFFTTHGAENISCLEVAEGTKLFAESTFQPEPFTWSCSCRENMYSQHRGGQTVQSCNVKTRVDVIGHATQNKFPLYTVSPDHLCSWMSQPVAMGHF